MILIDYVSITFKKHSLTDVVRLIGMEDVNWETLPGSKGYRSRWYYNGVSVFFDGMSEFAVWLEMSGQGCRAFETYGTGRFDELFELPKKYPGEIHITRLDVAYDDHKGILELPSIADQIEHGLYTSRSSYWDVTKSSKGTSCYIGSPKSDIRFRIYDKAAERGKIGEHWIRIEMQLRDDHALNFALLKAPVGEKFVGVLKNYVVFRDKPEGIDSNKRRWPVSPWYDELVGDAEAIRLAETPGVEYNVFKCQDYVVSQAGLSIDAYIQCVGLEQFLRELSQHKIRVKPNPKYKAMIDDYRAYMESDEEAQRQREKWAKIREIEEKLRRKKFE